MTDIFIELKGIKKSFGGVKALKGVDLTIRKGEVHCLAGENGCGKSTLIKVISGAHEADEGEVIIDGTHMNHFKPIDAIKMGIQVIYQDFAVFPNLTVAENIALNFSLAEGRKKVNWKETKQLALKAMEQIGAVIDPDILLERLSVAKKQMVAICRAILNDAKLIIMDEPTTALTANEVDHLFQIIRTLKEKGIAVVIVNHKLDEVYDIADKLTILRNGENVATGDIKSFDRPTFIKYMTGRDIVETVYQPDEIGDDILKVEHITREGSFEDVSFTLKKGDVLGITGLLGSGRGEIGDALFGVQPIESGKIYLKGKEIQIKSIDDAIRYKIGYVPEDRLTQGLFLECSIGINTVAASMDRYFNKTKLDQKKMYGDMISWIDKIHVAAPGPEPAIRTLSGGNQQKVVIAKWLNTEPTLLILNGPTVGVDIGSKSDIHGILHGLVKEGMGIIIISDDLSELIQNCNRILIMRGGRLESEVNAREINETQLSDLLSGKVQEVNQS